MSETQVIGRGQAVQAGAGDLAGPPSPRPAATGFAGLLRRPASRWARVALVAVNLAAVAAFLVSYSRHGVGFGPYRIDLGVYRMGGQTWLHGGDLYRQVLVTGGLRLPFTYPPAAAVVLAPLALLPMTAAGTVLTVASIALAAVVLAVFVRRLAGPLRAAGSLRAAGWLWAAGWLLPAALLLEPVRSTVAYGQVNIVLMALVTLDALTVAPRWPRGALTGLAAALKLTPAAFVLFFLLRRDYRAAAVAGVSFAAVTAAGFVLAGPDSARYWTAIVFQTGRPGSPATATNQCLQAVLARAGLDPHTPPGAAAWLLLSAIVVVAAWRGMRHALAAGEVCLALSLNAFAALLISPVSWSHHWVWAAPALLTLADLARRHRCRRRLAGAAAAAGLILFTAAPQWWLAKFAGPALNWAPWQQAIGSSYVFFAALVLLLAACGQLTPPSTAVRRLRTHRPLRQRFMYACRVTEPRRVLIGWDWGAHGIWWVLTKEEKEAPAPAGHWRGTPPSRRHDRPRPWSDRLSGELLDALQAWNDACAAAGADARALQERGRALAIQVQDELGVDGWEVLYQMDGRMLRVQPPGSWPVESWMQDLLGYQRRSPAERAAE